ncbi:hypothetical protein Vadar_009433 [Vaccinium darrowii]|uniref:Uncharacterized protein n=1 Tax=Vaccinium darrowii TaxID=229202 RepID=A0ACB7ZII2_9ERIC|nr:hypothetical protein Vadar_009433 [Vaccinium darrowii]
MVSKSVECNPTQESQAGSSKFKRDTRSKGNGRADKVIELEVDNGDDTDDYDLDSSSSSSDEDEIYDSDSEVEDDDTLFDVYVENDEEFDGCNAFELTKEHAAVVDELGDEDVVSSDDLRSIDSESDGDNGRVKHSVFNEKTDMVNPTFKVGMEFKSHTLFRDAVKEHAIKWGKEITFSKSDKRQVRVGCKKGCPWTIYCAYVPNDEVYRVKTFVDQHDCVRSFNVPWVSTKWIVKNYAERIGKNLTWPIPSLIETIESENTVKINHQKAYRANRIAMQML